jgi:hypothetical protein
MYITSAHALNQLLSGLLANPEHTQSLATACARQLNLTGPDAEPRAVVYVYDLVQRIRDDIEALPFDEETKAAARKHFQPFAPILSFNFFNLDLGSARSNVLHAGNLVGLTNLQGMLWMHARQLEVDRGLFEIANEMRGYIAEIADANLPQHIKMSIHKRLDQIASMLENVVFYGPENTQEQLEALVGSIVFHNHADRSLFERLTKSAGKAFTLLERTDKGLDIASSLPTKIAGILGFDS